MTDRQLLLNVAYRLLGSYHDAEDAVQETYARWAALDDGQRQGIDSPDAWNVRVIGRVCLDMLGSARARREQYVGEWLPEPLPDAASDPAERVTLDESVSMALMVVLESLTPAERVSFVLHDVFGMSFDEVATTVGRSPDAVRQLASTARRHIRDRRQAAEPDRSEHARVVAEFATACMTGDLQTLLPLLDPSVVAVSDGGGKARAALNPIFGAQNVARFLLGLMNKAVDTEFSFEPVNGELGIVARSGGLVYATGSVGIRDGRLTNVWMTLNPDKLTKWNEALTAQTIES
ncbi:RNA polymerase sigma factor SigJ [Cryobacterium sp. BB736]|uniref:RNA polymerase sigma factor SigJ n=1 Tax=Cryobacterium sp. BB736 TaxID=2746963 RepID=UPI0018761497|nr:RNA polymerase sigma factor SigJ [Cryobacterium sp. BB736]